MAYVLIGHDITADKVFSMAQYFNILQVTMAIFYPLAVAFAAEAAISIKRIEVNKCNVKLHVKFNRPSQFPYQHRLCKYSNTMFCLTRYRLQCDKVIT